MFYGDLKETGDDQDCRRFSGRICRILTILLFRSNQIVHEKYRRSDLSR